MPHLPTMRRPLAAAAAAGSLQILAVFATSACSASDAESPTDHANRATSDLSSNATLNLTQYVNPFIGTDPGNSSYPGNSVFSAGDNYPGPSAPFGMVQFSSDTRMDLPSGYRYSDTTIQDFSLTHFAGPGCTNNSDLQLLPITGNLSTSPGTAWTNYASGYTKSNESASAGYYKTRLDQYSTDVELTATTRTGMARVTYPATTAARFLINSSRSSTGSRDGSISVSGSQVTGHMTAGGFCGSSNTFPIYFAMEFDRAPTGFGTWNGGTISDGSTSTSGTNTGAYLTFDTSSANTVQVKVGISFVSVQNAQQNLATENAGWDFDAVRANTVSAWNAMLNRIQVTGGSTTDLRKFYTSLYRSFQSPSISSDVNGQYMGFDHALHTANGMTVYQDYSGWDIYRSWAALVAFVAPDVMTDIVKSMVLDGQQGGLLPKWPEQSYEDFIMNGDPGPIIVSSAYAFGVHDFDTAAALALMEKSSNGGTIQGNAIRGKQSELMSQGFISADPSDSLEYSTSDFAVAQFAGAVGDTAKYNEHMVRAQWWANVFSTDTGYITRRNSDKSWVTPLDPGNGSGYTEGSAAQYVWNVNYNYASLIDMIGGRETAIQRLDQHFVKLNDQWNSIYNWSGNEPSLDAPWVYNYARYPAGSSSVVHRILNESYYDGPGGLPGNDDLGVMSAWYVWGALGMYPITPGADVLVLNSPAFASILVQRAAGNIQINSTGSGVYVQGLNVNGAATTHSYLRYSDIAAGGTLDYALGAAPSSTWGTGAGDVPPSFQDGWTPPPAALELGANLALGKSVTGSAPCAATETPDKAVDGSLSNNSKWCSLAANASLIVDLGSAQNVSSFVIKHAGLGGETTAWNTSGYTIETSLDNATWTTVATMSGSTASRSFYPIASISARYVRLTATTPASDGNKATRIYEFEIYGGAHPTGAVSGLANKCIDVNQSGQVNGTKVQLWDCNGTRAQQWSLMGDGTLRALGKCLDATSSGTANGTLVQLWDCNSTGAQQWVAGPNGSLRNPESGRCLDVPNSNTANGTQLQIYDCNGTGAQQWVLPAQ